MGSGTSRLDLMSVDQLFRLHSQLMKTRKKKAAKGKRPSNNGEKQ